MIKTLLITVLGILLTAALVYLVLMSGMALGYQVFLMIIGILIISALITLLFEKNSN